MPPSGGVEDNMDKPWKHVRVAKVSIDSDANKIDLWPLPYKKSPAYGWYVPRKFTAFEELPAFLRQQIALLDVAHPSGEVIGSIKGVGESHRIGYWSQYFIEIPRKHRKKVWYTP